MKRTLFLSIGCMFALIGCNDNLSEKENNPPAMTGTRVTIGDKSITDGALGLYLKASGEYAGHSNVSYTYIAGAWRTQAGESIKMNPNNAEWGVYYPYNKEQENSGTKIYLSPSVRSSEKPQDIWFCPHTSNSETDFGQLTLALKQAYSRIKFSFVRSDSYKGEALLYGFSMREIYVSSKLDVTVPDGAYESNRGSKDFYYYGNLPIGEKVATGEQASAVLDILLIPQELNSPLYITAIVAEQDAVNGGLIFRSMNHAIQPSAFEESRIKAGAVYEITVTVSGKDISTTGAFLRKEVWEREENDLGNMTEQTEN